MPNWCANQLKIAGPKAELERFIKSLDPKAGLFGSILPTPKELMEKEEGHGSLPEWYSWRCSHWGTKWDVPLKEVYTNKAVLDAGKAKVLILSFDTAWGTPSLWLARVAEEYPKLHFRLYYSEGGNDFAGLVEIKNGLVGDIDYGRARNLPTVSQKLEPLSAK